MAAIRSQCPKCRKILKLKTKAALGKRVPCPQCSEPFIVEEYEAPELVDSFLDDEEEGETFDYAGYEEAGGGEYDDYGDDEYDDYGGDDYDDYEEDAPPKKRSKASSGGKKSSKSKKKKKSAGLPAWAPMALIGGGAVAVVGGLIGALIAFGPFGGSSNAVNLAWLPADAEVYGEARVGEMWNSSILAPVRENASVKNGLKEMQEDLQIQPGDIESVSFAIKGLEGSGSSPMMMNPLMGMGGMGSGQSNVTFLVVVRSSKVFDQTEMKANTSEATHNGTTYYQDPGDVAMFLPNDKTLIVGSESLITAAIDQGATEPRVEWMDFADTGDQLILAAKNPGNTGPPATDEVASRIQVAKAAFIALSLASDVTIETGVDCANDADATLLKTKLDESVSQARTEMEQKLGQVPPQFAGIADIGKSIMNSVSGSTSGSVLTVSVAIPGTIGTEIEKLTKDPMMGMMLGGLMAQGMSGFGGPPGFGGGNPGGANPGIGSSRPGSMSRPGSGNSNPVPGATEAAQKVRSKNNLRQLMLAVHNYHDVYNRFPETAITGPDGQTKHSWRVALLPFLEQRDLYEQYKLDEPWDSPNNRQVLARMPDVFRHPAAPSGSTNSCYFGLIGPETAMGDGTKPLGFRDVVDGTSNTIFFVETKRDIPWTKPEDIPVPSISSLPEFGGFTSDGFHVVLCDGRVTFLANSIDTQTLQNLVNRKDGNPVNLR